RYSWLALLRRTRMLRWLIAAKLLWRTWLIVLSPWLASWVLGLSTCRLVRLGLPRWLARACHCCCRGKVHHGSSKHNNSHKDDPDHRETCPGEGEEGTDDHVAPKNREGRPDT